MLLRRLCLIVACLAALDAHAVTKVLGFRVVAAPVCGDGARNGLEDCDCVSGCSTPTACGGAVDCGTATCANIGHGFTGGTLACGVSCLYDTSGCTGFVIADDFSTDPFASRMTVDNGGSNWTWESGAQDIAHIKVFGVSSARFTYATLPSANHWAKIQLKQFTGTSAWPNIPTGVELRGQSTGAAPFYAVTVRPDNGRIGVWVVTAGSAQQIGLGTGGAAGRFIDNSGCNSATPGVPFACCTGIGAGHCPGPPESIGASVSGTNGSTLFKAWRNPVGADATAWAADHAADFSATIDCTTAGPGVCSAGSSTPGAACTNFGVTFNGLCPGGTCTATTNICVNTGAYCGIYIDDTGAADETTIVDDLGCGP